MTPDPALVAAAEAMAREIAMLTAAAGREVHLDGEQVLDRSDSLRLRAPSRVSPNGRCHLIEARDGWIAVNLPRDDDIDLVAAWLEVDGVDDPWSAIAAAARREPTSDFVARGAGLGLAVARLGETPPPPPAAAESLAEGTAPMRPLRVLDLSSLWAGPLCAGILAAAGHDVLKVECRRRPDPVARTTPALDARLNGGKRRRTVDFSPDVVRGLIDECDLLVTSARPRAFAAPGIAPTDCMARNPALIWVAITGHGWHGASGLRIGFGDDAAVAGGLVGRDGSAPRFLGDAAADPLTGLAAATAALRAIVAGSGGLIDVSLASTAAVAAARP